MTSTSVAQGLGEALPDTPENQAAWESFPRWPHPCSWTQAGIERLSVAQLNELLATLEAERHRRGMEPKRGEA